MSSQTNKSSQSSSNEFEEVVDSPAVDRAEVDALIDETDDLLDEIDSVLEENAEEFVNSYVQKGGQ